MTKSSIYQNIALRTGGNIYIGVVGPVRTGKSTFIKRMAEALLIPNISDPFMRERAFDELPQSGSGKTIMTAEPKFIPEEAVHISLGGSSEMSVRMIDSVGFLVEGALGDTEEGADRMVATPWSDQEIPMRQAAEIGTSKVINDHSTIGVVVTTDGSFTDIPRSAYIDAERRVINELKEIGKPFVVIVNTDTPMSTDSIAIAEQIENDYGVSAFTMNCLTMGEAEANEVIRRVLMEFPINETAIILPEWVPVLGQDHALTAELMEKIRLCAESLHSMHDAAYFSASISNCELIESAVQDEIDPGTGIITIRISMPRALFYETISSDTGLELKNDADLASIIRQFAYIKTGYEKASEAIEEARINGYGVIMPEPDEVILNEPDIVKRGGKYGLKLRASAPAIHLIRTVVETEVSPAVKGEGSSEELLQRLLEEFEGDSSRIWKTNMFGKSLSEIAEEGLTSKIRRLPSEVCSKLGSTLTKTINEGGNGIICIVF